MSITKHKIFKLKLSGKGNFNVSEAVEKTINDFLMDSNNVYVNHSITVLTEDVKDFGKVLRMNRYVLISMVYKDLKASSLDLKSVSENLKESIHKQIESGIETEAPNIETDLEKDMKQLIENR